MIKIDHIESWYGWIKVSTDINNKNPNKIEKSNHKFIDVPNQEKFFVRISDIVVPFSNFIKKRQINDIYIGKEKHHLKERNSEFKTILRKEFSKAIKEFGNNYSD